MAKRIVIFLLLFFLIIMAYSVEGLYEPSYSLIDVDVWYDFYFKNE